MSMQGMLRTAIHYLQNRWLVTGLRAFQIQVGHCILSKTYFPDGSATHLYCTPVWHADMPYVLLVLRSQPMALCSEIVLDMAGTSTVHHSQHSAHTSPGMMWDPMGLS